MNNERKDYSNKPIFSLDGRIEYQIQIAGQVGDNWSDWLDNVDCQYETRASGLTITILTGSFDQAALIGLLRRFYSMGFPLISVNCMHQE